MTIHRFRPSQVRPRIRRPLPSEPRRERLWPVIAQWRSVLWEQGRAAAAIDHDARILATVERWTGADPRYLSAQQLQQFLNRVDIVPSTRTGYHAVLRSWFDFLARSGRINGNPVDDLVVLGAHAAVVVVAASDRWVPSHDLPPAA